MPHGPLVRRVVSTPTLGERIGPPPVRMTALNPYPLAATKVAATRCLHVSLRFIRFLHSQVSRLDSTTYSPRPVLFDLTEIGENPTLLNPLYRIPVYRILFVERAGISPRAPGLRECYQHSPESFAFNTLVVNVSVATSRRYRRTSEKPERRLCGNSKSYPALTTTPYGSSRPDVGREHIPRQYASWHRH